MAFFRVTTSRSCLLLLAALVLAGCATTQQFQQPPPAAYSLDSDDIMAWYGEARDVVEAQRGVNLQQVTVSTVTSREMLFVLSDLYGKKLDPGMTADMRVRVFADRAFAEVGFLQAVYDPFAKRIIVNQENLTQFVARLARKGVGAREVALTVLIHELVHAADDADYDLVAVEKQHPGDALGVYMMAEGHAELQTEIFCEFAGCSQAFELARAGYQPPDPHRTSAEAIHAMRSSNLLLLYGQSQKFLKELKARDPDGDLIHQAMQSPPGSALDFFDSATFPNSTRTESRERVYRVLNAVNLENNGHALLKLPASPYDDSVLPLAQPGRLEFVQQQREIISGAGKMLFINQHERNASGVSVFLYEASGPEAVQEKWREFESSHQSFLAELRRNGVSARHIDDKKDAGPVQLPPRATVNIAQIDNRQTGKTVRLYSSLYIDGNYLIAVSNADDLALNKKAMLQVIEQLKVALRS